MGEQESGFLRIPTRNWKILDAHRHSYGLIDGRVRRRYEPQGLFLFIANIFTQISQVNRREAEPTRVPIRKYGFTPESDEKDLFPVFIRPRLTPVAFRQQ
jgi:hypothetical protein